MALDPKDPRYTNLTSTPLRPALIVQLDKQSRLVAEKKLEREGARVSTAPLHSGHRLLLVTTDMSAGFGSYSGPVTELLDVSGGRLQFTEARNRQSGKVEPIYLASTLKTAWKFTPYQGDSAESTDILAVACRPDADASAFYITYSRFHWTGKEWIGSMLRRRGFWESDEAFPPVAAFPRVSPDDK